MTDASLATREGPVVCGVATCAGCGLELIARILLNVMGPETIIVIPPGCAALFSGYGKESALRIPGMQGNLENTAAYAAGIRAGLDATGRSHVNVVALAGDGATVDIGLQALSGALERGDRILYLCYDNEGYMNTGIQGSGSTSLGAWTTTTPAGKPNWRKNMVQIVAAHGIPYVANASMGYVDDLRRKIEKAKDMTAHGPAYLHVYTSCPTGWRHDSAISITVAKLATESKVWPLYEIVNGRWRNTVTVKNHKPVSDYLKAQGRFKHLTEAEIATIQKLVDREYDELQLRFAPK